MITPRFLGLLLCALNLFSQKSSAPLDESDKEGVLEILFVTAAGARLSGEPKLTVDRLVDGKVVDTRTGERKMRLRYGTYRLRAQYGGAYPVDKAIKVERPYQVVSICFFVAPIELPWDGNLVRGSISEKSKQGDCRWVRFVSPFAENESAETLASPSGQFALENVRPGKYLVFSIGKEGICEMSEVTILLGKSVYDLLIRWAEPDRSESERRGVERGPRPDPGR